jgi:hypothetical protein
MNSTNRFNKNSGCYTCACCGKQTRETGLDESSIGLCAYCYLEGGIENDFSDGNITQEEFDKQIAYLKERYSR